MIYEIQSKTDILTGASLVITIPSEDLDRKALHTIQGDKPGFLLPFRHRAIDGQIELTYQIGEQCKLQHLAGDRDPKEYAEIWSGALCPLFDCGDWFLRPYSFVLDIEHIYCDKNKNTVSYVYIPSIRDCSDYYSLKEMAAEFSRKITVTSPDLENKVLRAIMLDFNPKTFLQMLKCSAAANEPAARVPHAQPRHVNEQKTLPVQDRIPAKKEDASAPEADVPQQPESAAGVLGEIIIDIPADRKAAKKAEKIPKKHEISLGVNTNPAKSRKSAVSIFKKKPDTQREAVMETDFISPLTKSPAQPIEYEPLRRPPPDIISAEVVDVTENTPYEISGAWLRLVGAASLPPTIEVAIAEGEVFTVGRHDAAAGRRQSSFEFNKNTKAVSRRHAAIERRADGYSLIDLSSSAGTFIDGEKLPPNTPCALQPGCQISFGVCGADYIWKQ